MSFDLTPYNTLGLKASALVGHMITDEGKLKKHLLNSKYSNKNTWILGGGSNVILKPELPGQVLLMKMQGKTITPEANQADRFLLNVAAGENWHQLVKYSVAQGLSGLENLALIPGSVGAAPVQNIGAYGVELSELLSNVRAMHRETGKVNVFSNAECCFAYRDSLFKQPDSPWVILDITLQLSTDSSLQTTYPDLSAEINFCSALTLNA